MQELRRSDRGDTSAPQSSASSPPPVAAFAERREATTTRPEDEVGDLYELPEHLRPTPLKQSALAISVCITTLLSLIFRVELTFLACICLSCEYRGAGLADAAAGGPLFLNVGLAEVALPVDYKLKNIEVRLDSRFAF